MTAKCNIQECNLNTFSTYNECVLHCKKGDYPEVRSNQGILVEFRNELINYISDFIMEHRSDSGISRFIEKEEVRESVQKSLAGDEETSIHLKSTIIFDGIYFPCRDGRDTYDYLKVLKKLSKVHFIRCKFTAHSLELKEVEAFYDECNFYQWWSLTQPNYLLM